MESLIDNPNLIPSYLTNNPAKNRVQSIHIPNRVFVNEIPGNIQFDFYDQNMINPEIFEKNFNRVLKRINGFNVPFKITGNFIREWYFDRKYHQFPLFSTNCGILTNDQYFKISNNDRFSEQEVDAAATFIVESLKASFGFRF